MHSHFKDWYRQIESYWAEENGGLAYGWHIMELIKDAGTHSWVKSRSKGGGRNVFTQPTSTGLEEGVFCGPGPELKQKDACRKKSNSYKYRNSFPIVRADKTFIWISEFCVCKTRDNSGEAGPGMLDTASCRREAEAADIHLSLSHQDSKIFRAQEVWWVTLNITK